MFFSKYIFVPVSQLLRISLIHAIGCQTFECEMEHINIVLKISSGLIMLIIMDVFSSRYDLIL